MRVEVTEDLFTEVRRTGGGSRYTGLCRFASREVGHVKVGLFIFDLRKWRAIERHYHVHMHQPEKASRSGVDIVTRVVCIGKSNTKEFLMEFRKTRHLEFAANAT